MTEETKKLKAIIKRREKKIESLKTELKEAQMDAKICCENYQSIMNQIKQFRDMAKDLFWFLDPEDIVEEIRERLRVL